MKSVLDRLFLKGRQISIKKEVEGGFATFFTMSYIIFVQPAVLSKLGMDMGAVMIATCIASAIATATMAFLANYPIALAPGMGHNFLFVLVATSLGISWNKALTIIFISGSIFIALSLIPFREKILNDIPNGLKHGISVGIGFLITLIGLEWSGIVVSSPGTIVGLGNLKDIVPVITFAGLILIIFLYLKSVSSAIIWGILFSTALSLIAGLSNFNGILSMPPSLYPTFLKLDFTDILTPSFLNALFVFLFLDVFDTVGTLVGIGEQGKFIVNGKLPRAKGAFLSDAIGTVTGSLLGTSTVTSYIESAAGVGVGAKTGLANIVTAFLFILAIFFYPLVKTVGGGVERNELIMYPTIAPALIFVGFLMIQNLKNIDFHQIEESLPAFLSIIIIPMTFSITDGISFGFISYTLIMLFKGELRKVSPVVYVLSVIFVIKYILFK